MLSGKVLPFRREEPNPYEHADDELMRQAAAGDRAAFAVLVQRHIAPLTSFCTKLLGDPEMAREVVQETFVQVWLNAGRYVPQGKFRLFLLRATHNASRNRRRALRRLLQRQTADLDGPALDQVSAQDPDQLDLMLLRERQRRVRRAILRLPMKLREALLLRFTQDMDYAEIATVLGRPEATIRTRVFHGLRTLRGWLDGEREP